MKKGIFTDRSSANGGLKENGGGGAKSIWISRRGGVGTGGRAGFLRRYGSTMTVTDIDPSISCTTFNILAPIYKRLDHEDQSRRESHYKVYWLTRNQNILDRLLSELSSIICLQEVWVGNEEFVEMYEKRLGEAGYISFKLARTNNRGDGLLTALHKDHFKLLNYRELLFNDFGDRVAQLLHVESVVPFWQGRNNEVQQQVIIVNTHLLFPHNHSFSIIRLHQVYKILQYVEAYQKEQNLSQMPIILCGDWNGSKRGHVYKLLRSQEFVSSYDTAHHYTDSDADAHRWVSHRNHRGNICGVDFIWLLNPNKYRKPLKTSWNEAVFSIVENLLRKAALTEDNAFAFLKGDHPGDYVTFDNFCLALDELGVSGHPEGLSCEEMKDLWIEADLDGNGVLDFDEFQRIWNSTYMEEQQQYSEDIMKDLSLEVPNSSQPKELTVEFVVKTAELFPPEAAQGTWPENYSLSDHAPLTVVFSPRRLASNQPVC
ncbi:Calcium-binding endonuclease/exonuclease/phosphatase family [Zostera marina]|uniref:Calcium-binding endonuclease/exonuclease/phosphatase family n=1 Tax=Zostera marina TaxID=29655 RepID=A0A0K9Q4R5_ZOSMR|nr:Calcium-binding endonuclease/exonuclease/phosphatase family [Zostera marina]